MPDAKVTVTLFAPPAFWKLPESERARMGCGPGRGIGDLIVPDHFYGLKIKAACDIHDFMYSIGENEGDREIADRVLLNNCVRIVTAKTDSRILRRLRLRRAKTYYWFVRTFGGPAFWNHKNLPGEEGEVTI